MLTAETLAVNELFQLKSIQFGDDLFGIGLGTRSRLAGRRVSEGDDRGDRGVRRNAEILTHPVMFVGSDRVRTAPDAEGPCRDHHVLRDPTGIETEAFGQKDDRDRDRAAIQIPRGHDRVREIVAMLTVLEDDEAPRLRVLRASGRASGLKDLREHVLRHGALRVLADFAFRNSGQVSVQRIKYPRP